MIVSGVDDLLVTGRSHRPRFTWPDQARLALLAVTHRYKRTHCLRLEQFQTADRSCRGCAAGGTVRRAWCSCKPGRRWVPRPLAADGQGSILCLGGTGKYMTSAWEPRAVGSSGGDRGESLKGGKGQFSLGVWAFVWRALGPSEGRMCLTCGTKTGPRVRSRP